MKLQKIEKKFTTVAGYERRYNLYYVECLGKKVYLEVKNDSDKSLLAVCFEEDGNTESHNN